MEIFINGKLIKSEMFLSSYDPDKIFIQSVGENVLGNSVQFIGKFSKIYLLFWV